MSVQSEIDRLNEAKAAIIAAFAAKGIVVVEGEKLDAMAEKIAQIATGVELPELENPALATDIASGKSLYDDEGNLITGTLSEGTEGTRAFASGDVKVDGASGDTVIVVSGVYDPNNRVNGFIARSGMVFAVRDLPTSLLGDARRDQVAKGATFTSAAGYLVEGTMEVDSGGASLPDGAVAVQIVIDDEASTQIGSGYSLSITYGDDVEISDSIALAFSGTTKTLNNISDSTDFSVLYGKYIRTGSSFGSTSSAKYYYIPTGATFTVSGTSMSKTLTCDKAQAVSLQKISI